MQVLLIDDDSVFVRLLETYVAERFPDLDLITCTDPLLGLKEIHADLGLLLIDLEMPGLDGVKLHAYATSKGLPKGRIVILSARDPDYLRQHFPMGCCLAVLNKYEARQREVLDMIFTSLLRKQQEH